MLCKLLEKHDNFRATIFVIPGRCSDRLLDWYRKADWVEICAEGLWGSTLECATWTYEFTKEVLASLEGMKIIRPPGGIANPEFYDAVQDMGWIVADDMRYLEMWKGTTCHRYLHNGLSGAQVVTDPDLVQPGEFGVASEFVRGDQIRSYMWAVLDEIDFQPGDFMVDCGAYEGEEIEVVLPLGVEVLSFEPHPDRARRLGERWDNVEGVEIVGAAVGTKEGTTTLYESSRFVCGSSTMRSKAGLRPGGVEVPEVRLADVIRERVPKVLKLDIEGSEWAILDDLLNEGLLERIPFVYVEDHINRIEDQSVHALRASVLSRCQLAEIQLREWV